MRYALLLLLCSCASTSFTKAGATDADLEKDRQACYDEMNPGMVLFGAFAASGQLNACMEKRGWSKQ